MVFIARILSTIIKILEHSIDIPLILSLFNILPLVTLILPPAQTNLKFDFVLFTPICLQGNDGHARYFVSFLQ